MSSDAPGSPRPASRVPRVLVVDDEADLRELIEITLVSMGLDVDCAATLQDAQRHLARGGYALCLTDMRLPDGEGIDLVSTIARQHPNTPVAVITSSEAAALRDVIAVIGRRNAGVHVVVIPAAVQGDAAPESLLAALDRLARWVRGTAEWQGTVIPAPEVLIIGRGGGSREDLWAFNHEGVARAIAVCPIPTISAVGHETDVTIADLVADLRAATPSVAAEHAVPVLADVRELVTQLAGMMADGLQDRVEVARRGLDRRADALTRRAQLVVERRRVRIDRVAARLAPQGPRAVERRRARVETLGAMLEARSPLAVFARGFAVARGANGATLSQREAFIPGTPFDLLLRDGRVRATTDSVHADAPHLRTDA